MVASYTWNKVAAPSGYEGICYSWGNYLAVATKDGVYDLKWELLRRQLSGGFTHVPGSGVFTQSFAVRPFGPLGVEQALAWAENEIAKFRSRRQEPKSDMF